MSAMLTDAPKVEDMIAIEVDGKALKARKGAMLMDVTDAHDIYVPRFCYHRLLSVAANCRMCLVEIERAPKPQPACATPVMDGMKVYTKSPKAIAAQQATMEFLLINHPLDCPICDQGGECELQDLALGYGSAVSQFTERKRVVRDKNIGPLVQTDMTRCIHCTRCVRFGEEVAGLRELGATGRGEHMEIGTYVAQAMTSELSGNVIDLCPVGALTSKPYRYSARAWELRQHDSIAPHDCVGSNVHVHVKGQVVKRVVPKENDAINETWLADRDRYSYQGLTSADRLLSPRLKENGRWRECDWDTAFSELTAALRNANGSLGALAAPSSTCEELFLLQRLVRGLGSQHVDHRLRQKDFAADASEPRFPALGTSLADLEHADAVIIIGGYPRHDQPLVNHRVRKAAMRGAQIVVLDTLAQDYNFDLEARVTVAPSQLVASLGGLVRACADRIGPADQATGMLAHYTVDATAREIADRLIGRKRLQVLAGTRLQSHPHRTELLGLAAALAERCSGRLGVLTEGANAAGAWLAGAVPHRGPGGRLQTAPGLAAASMLSTPLSTYLLLGLEPGADCADPLAARRTLQAAKFVAALTAFASPDLETVASLLLPIAAFAENEGSYVNVQGQWQEFVAAVKPPGSGRAAWKVLRAAGEQSGLAGFDAVTCQDITRELRASCGPLEVVAPAYTLSSTADSGAAEGLERITHIPLYRADPLVRRAGALQMMPQAGDDNVHLAATTLADLALVDGATINVVAGGASVTARVVSDSSVPAGCCLIYGATALAAQLPNSDRVTIQAVRTVSD